VNKELRILIVDNLATDVVMINHELRKGGVAFCSKRVETQKDFIRELGENPPEVILSDHGVPSFDGFAALATARKTCPDVPFIFVSGWKGEAIVTQSFKSGATDFVLKSQLPNLVPAVQRALNLVEERARRKAAERGLGPGDGRYRQLVEVCPDALLVQSDDCIVFANSAAAWMLGAENAGQLIGKPLKQIIHPDYWEMTQRRMRQLHEQGTTFFWRSNSGRMQRLEGDIAVVPFIEEKLVGLDGRVVDVQITAAPMTFQERPSVQVIARDITPRKRVPTSPRKCDLRH
jgi:PAS domain S-box-containing protein